jgi:hypothetical protein
MRKLALLLLVALIGGGVVTGAPTTAVASHCAVSARLSPDYTYNRYRITGAIRCGGSGTRRLECKAIHRHSTYWHSHSAAIIESHEYDFTRTSGWISGTDDDTYKANCKGYYNGSYQRTAESPAYNL